MYPLRRPWLLAVLPFLFAAFLARAEETKPPEITVPKLTQAPPVIDGNLGDAAWAKAAKSEAFRRTYGEADKVQCFFRIMQDDKALYVAIECPEADTKNLKADVTEHDGDGIWDDDDIELFINPTGAKDFPYYQIILNAKGVTFDEEMKTRGAPDKTWEPKYEARTVIGREGWTAELAIPWSCFDRTEKSAAEWTFNISHVRTAGELLFWSPVHDESSHQPEKFGKLKGMPERKLKPN